ncbi:hypothetical protein A9Q77_05170 [Marinomonas sp. 42_23_T18]|nr:hypothetical protein A9Q77_05170 [Marinomonas sp. 42_23_T18]
MWLLLAVFLSIIAFIFIKRAEQQQEQDNTPNKQRHEQNMQTHSVVTDVVHEEESQTKSKPLDGNETETDPLNEQNEAVKTNTQKVEIQEELSDFLTHYSALKKQFEMVQEWRLFNSDAAFFWHKDNPIITILCLASFQKGAATSLNYKDYHFHIESWSWHGASPKGAATEIKKQLTLHFKKS